MNVNDLVRYAATHFLFSEVSVNAGSGDEIPHLLLRQVGLRVLRVHNCAVSQMETWQRLLSQVSHLRELSLVSCGIKSIGFIVKQPALAHLTTLNLSGNHFDNSDLAPLLRKLPVIEHLYLSNVVLCTAQVTSTPNCPCKDIFAVLGRNRTITVLDISSNQLCERGVERFVSALETNHSIKTLIWDRTGIESETYKRQIENFIARNKGPQVRDSLSEIERLVMEGKSEPLEKFIARDLGHQKCQDAQGNGIFHFIAKHEKTSLVGVAVKAAYPIHRVNHRRETALHVAAQNGYGHLIEDFFKHGIEGVIDDGDCEGNTALMLAGLSEHIEIVKRLADEQANVNHQNLYHNTLLHELVLRDKIEVLAQLLKEPKLIFDFYCYNALGMTPLHLAASLARKEAISHFYACHVDMDTLDSQGNTALHVAVFHYKLFFEEHAKDGSDDAATKDKQFRETIESLIHYGADLDLKNAEGVSAANMVDAGSVIHNFLVSLTTREWSRKPTPAVIRNLVFEGGSVKGIAYYGAIKECTSIDKPIFNLSEIQRIAGTSAGAITALLLALGYLPKEIKGIVQRINFIELLDGNPQAKKLVLECKEKNTFMGIMQLFLRQPITTLFQLMKTEKNLGLFDGESLLKLFREWIKIRSGDGNLTFLELHQKALESGFQKFKDLYIIGLDATTRRMQVFSYEDTPHVIIADAVRISMSIPVVFVPHSPHVKAYLKGKEEGNTVRTLASGYTYKNQKISKQSTVKKGDEKHLFIDGGCTDNYFLKVFDHKGFIDETTSGEKKVSTPVTFNRQTLGLSIVTGAVKKELQKGENPTEFPSSGIGGFLLNTALSFYEKQTSDRRFTHEHLRTVYIVPQGVKTLDFDLTKGEVKNLIRSGKKAAYDFKKRVNLGPGAYYMRPELIALFAKYSAECFVVQEDRGLEIKITSVKARCAELIYEVYRSGTTEEKTMLREKLHLNLLNTDNQGNNALHIAVSRGDCKTLMALIEASHPFLDAVNKAGETPLDLVFTLTDYKQAKEILDTLIEKGAKKCRHFRNADSKSIQVQLGEKLQELLLKPVSYFLPFTSPLRLPLMEYSEECTMKKTDKGVVFEKISVRPCIELAVELTKGSTVDFELIRFLNLTLANIKDDNGQTILHRLCLQGRVKNVKRLLKNETFDPQLKDKQGKLLLDCVIEEREREGELNTLNRLDKILILLVRRGFPCAPENKKRVISRGEKYLELQGHLLDEEKRTTISKSLDPYREQ